MSDLAPPSGLQFHVGSIPVLVRPMFLLIPLLWASQLQLSQTAIWAGIVCVSVLLHELGHAWVMRAFGFAPSIELHAMGGLTHWPSGARPAAPMSLAVSLAGPGIQVLLGVVVYLVSGQLELSPLTRWAVSQVLFVNFGWAMVNLLPILPWDGGQSLDAFIGTVSKTQLRGKIVGAVSIAGGALIVAGAIFKRQVLLGYFGAVGVMNGWQRFNAPVTLEQVVDASADDEVEAIFKRVIEAGDFAVAQLISTRVFTKGRYPLAEKLLRHELEKTNASRAAFNLACTLCRLSRLDEAMTMLERAVSLGWSDLDALQADPGLAPLRDRRAFRALRPRS